MLDVQHGYLDKMLVTPVRRSTLLLGMGLAVGVRFETGVLGVLLV